MPPHNDQLQWIDINDFTPGIRTKLDYPASPLVAAPARLGEAQATNTFRCIALPNGGLGPMPRVVAEPSAPIIADAPAVTGTYHITGLFPFGPVGPQTIFVDDLFLTVEYLTATPSRRFKWFRLALHTIGFPTNTLVDLTSTASPTVPTFQATTQGATRIHPTDPTIPGNPVVATSWGTTGNPAADRNVWTFPNPATPAVTGVSTLALRSGNLVFHQGRIVMLEFNSYSFGGGGGDAIPTDENVCFTNANSPLATMTASAAAQVFVPEFPNGYLAVGSISAGELFLIKNQGGGVVVSGDIADPTVTRLPGVVTAGGTSQGHAASLPSGLFYMHRLGAYLWRGADTSTKVSNQLEDTFWLVPDAEFYGIRRWQAAEWGEWVLTTGNWIYDTITDGWWRLEDPSLYTVMWCGRGYDATLMWTTAGRYTNATAANVIKGWSRTNTAFTYSWQSHPIPKSINRLLDIREVVVRAQGTGTVTITLTGITGDTPAQPEVFTFTSASAPQLIRKTCYCKGENITVRIQSDSGGVVNPAPIVYEVRLGYNEVQLGGGT